MGISRHTPSVSAQFVVVVVVFCCFLFFFYLQQPELRGPEESRLKRTMYPTSTQLGSSSRSLEAAY